MEDSKIIELYWQRDESAIHKTEEKYGNYLNKIAFNVLMDAEDSKECVNDTYFQAWGSIPPNKPTHLSLYLGKIVRNLAINRLRDKSAIKRTANRYSISLSELEECVPYGNSLDEVIDENVLSELIGKYLRKVSDDARRCFIKKYFHMESIKEIAEFYEMSEAKVKILLHRTRKGLKEFLKKEGHVL